MKKNLSDWFVYSSVFSVFVSVFLVVALDEKTPKLNLFVYTFCISSILGCFAGMLNAILTELKAKKIPVDVSWMFHCSETPDNVINYNHIVDDKDTARGLNSAARTGFIRALRIMEDLDIVQMGDIDRRPNEADQKYWDNQLKNT